MCTFQLVTLRWDDSFDVEGAYYHGMCHYDFVEVRQRYSITNPEDIVASLCGTTSPGYQELQGPVMIRHHSDWILNGDGWSVQWITECKYVRETFIRTLI